VQPLLDVLGDAPEFFVARQNTAGDIVLLALAVTLVPPAVLTVVEAVVRGVSRPAGRLLHLGLVAVLAAALTLQVLDDVLGGSSAVLVPAAVALGAGAAVAYARTRAAPTLLTVLAPAPVIFLVVFLAVSPVSKLVFPASAAEASGTTIPGRTPVVVILLDELSGVAVMGPDRRIDGARLPGFARLARDATWYRNATGVADFTDRAVPPILTGERTEPGSVPTSADHPESLFTLLGGSYDFDVTEPVTDICPPRLCPREAAARPAARQRLRELAADIPIVSAHLLLPGDLERDLPPIDRSFGDFGDAAETADPGARGRSAAAFLSMLVRKEQFEDFIGRLGRPPKRRTLSFLHVQLPHHPYYFLPTGQRYPEGRDRVPGLEAKGPPAGTWTRDRDLVRQSHLRYLLQVGFADRLVGRALDRLRAAGRYDDSLVVVMADHGVSFAPGTPLRAATSENLAAIASVPLLVKMPHQRRARIDDRNVRTIDVLPTIAAGLRTRLPWRTEGVRAGTAAARTVAVQALSGPQRSMPFADYVRRRDALVARMAATFRLGSRDGLLRSGPDADLLGEPLAALGAAPAAGGRVELDDPGLLASVDPVGDFVPSLVGGGVTGVRDGDRLAVAVQGRIAAVAVPYREGGGLRFAAIVPPAAFVRGPNRVEVVRIAGRAPGRTFTLLRGGSATFRLARRGGGEVLVDEAGRRFPIGPGVEGSVDGTTLIDGKVEIKGWAGDTQRGRPAAQVVAFAGDRLLAAGRPSEEARGPGAALGRASFTLSGWEATLRGVPRDEPLRVLAVEGGRASPLPGVRRP
jgi:hypothetical protein